MRIEIAIDSTLRHHWDLCAADWCGLPAKLDRVLVVRTRHGGLQGFTHRDACA